MTSGPEATIERTQRPLVLFVEDSPDDQELARLALARLAAARQAERCEALFVDDGLAALEYLEAASKGEHRHPDIAVVDLAMPRMDGFGLLRSIRLDARWRTLPVIMFTTSTAESDVGTAYESGCNAYVVKPYSMKELTAVIEQMLDHWLGKVRLPIR